MFKSKNKNNTPKERNSNYKTSDQLTKGDCELIDADQINTGIICSDEYYYNNILYYNYNTVIVPSKK